MGEGSKIEWTDHTFNPWWGCVKISPGCTNCYAADLDARYFPDVGGELTAKAKPEHWGLDAPRRFFGDAHWAKPEKWDRDAAAAGERHRVFCASMADVLEDRPDLVEHRVRLWRLIRATPNLDWLILTKRIENAASMLPWLGADPFCKRCGGTGDVFDDRGVVGVAHRDILTCECVGGREPWTNVWLGTTAEDQERANERIPILLATPAAIRFVSYEPALELVDFGAFLPDGDNDARYECRRHGGHDYGLPDGAAEHPSDNCVACSTPREDAELLDAEWMPKLRWLIAGSESGPRARPAQLEWYREVRDQVVAAGASYFLKQHAEKGKKLSLPTIDGEQWTEFPK